MSYSLSVLFQVEKLTKDASSLHQNWKQERAALTEVQKSTRDRAQWAQDERKPATRHPRALDTIEGEYLVFK